MNYKGTCLHPVSLGFSVGILWGLYVFLIGLLAWLSGYGIEFVKFLGGIYIGYAPTLGGSLAGAVWGFVKGFVGAALVAWLYNCFACKSCGKCTCDKGANITKQNNQI